MNIWHASCLRHVRLLPQALPTSDGCRMQHRCGWLLRPKRRTCPSPKGTVWPIWSLAITSDQARRLLRAWDVSFHEGSPNDVINGKVAGRSPCRSPAYQSMMSSWICDLTALAFMRRTEVEPQAEANRHPNGFIAKAQPASGYRYGREPITSVGRCHCAQPRPVEWVAVESPHFRLFNVYKRSVPNLLASQGGFHSARHRWYAGFHDFIHVCVAPLVHLEYGANERPGRCS